MASSGARARGPRLGGAGARPGEAAAPALREALQRLVAEGRDNSHDARAAIEKTLSSAGAELARPSAGRPTGGRPAATGRKRRATVTADGASTGEASPASAAAGGATFATGGATSAPTMSAEDLRRLASPRARIAIRGVGTFELALFTSEAPATVLRFAHLAESGYYDGLTFHRVVPNFVI